MFNLVPVLNRVMRLLVTCTHIYYVRHSFSGGATREPRSGPERPETASPAAPNRDAIQAASRPSVTRGGFRASRFARTLQALWAGCDNPKTAMQRQPPNPKRDSGRLAAKRYGGRLRRSSGLRGSHNRPRGESSCFLTMRMLLPKAYHTLCAICWTPKEEKA